MSRYSNFEMPDRYTSNDYSNYIEQNTCNRKYENSTRYSSEINKKVYGWNDIYQGKFTKPDGKIIYAKYYDWEIGSIIEYDKEWIHNKIHGYTYRGKFIEGHMVLEHDIMVEYFGFVDNGNAW